MTTGFRNDALARYGEQVAARHLVSRGLTLIELNWSCPTGELDLVMRQGDTLVVVEVKTRSNTDHGHPLEAVDDEKIARVRALADLWCQERGVRPRDIRVDMVGVLRPRSGPAVVEHVAGV